MSDELHPKDRRPSFPDFRAPAAPKPVGIDSLRATSRGLQRLNETLRTIGEAMTDDVGPAEAGTACPVHRAAPAR